MGKFIIFIGIFLLVFRELVRGNIKSVGSAFAILIISIFLLAAGGRTIVSLIALGIPLYFFAKEYGLTAPESAMSVILASLPALLALYGLYIIFRGPFKK